MKKGTLWTRDEYIVVLNLYYKLPFGKLNRGTKEVKELAALMGRTNNSVAMRLSNFAACDPYIISQDAMVWRLVKYNVSPIGTNFIMIVKPYSLRVRRFWQNLRIQLLMKSL